MQSFHATNIRWILCKRQWDIRWKFVIFTRNVLTYPQDATMTWHNRDSSTWQIPQLGNKRGRFTMIRCGLLFWWSQWYSIERKMMNTYNYGHLEGSDSSLLHPPDTRSPEGALSAWFQIRTRTCTIGWMIFMHERVRSNMWVVGAERKCFMHPAFWQVMYKWSMAGGITWITALWFPSDFNEDEGVRDNNDQKRSQVECCHVEQCIYRFMDFWWEKVECDALFKPWMVWMPLHMEYNTLERECWMLFIIKWTYVLCSVHCIKTTPKVFHM